MKLGDLVRHKDTGKIGVIIEVLDQPPVGLVQKNPKFRVFFMGAGATWWFNHQNIELLEKN